MEDVNNQISWCLSRQDSLLPKPVAGLRWDDTQRCLALQPSVAVPPMRGTRGVARARARVAAVAVDAFGTWAWVAPGGQRVMTAHENAPPQLLWQADAGEKVVDLGWTVDGHILAALRHGNGSGRVVWLDSLARFSPVFIHETGFAPDRIATPAMGGAVWLVDRGGRKARLLVGTPVPQVLQGLPRRGDVFAPRPEMADPPRLLLPETGNLSGAEIIDASALPRGDLVLLRLPMGAGVAAQVERITPRGGRAVTALDGVIVPFTMAALSEDTVAVAVQGWTEARAFRVPELAAPPPVTQAERGRYPLRRWTGARFASGATGRVHYPTQDSAAPFRRLAALSFASHTMSGETGSALIDSGGEGFVWHRIYLDASLPKGSGIVVSLAAADSLADLGPGVGLWQHHAFGQTGLATAPQGVWLDRANERPWIESPIPTSRQKDELGLFTCLIQSDGQAMANRRVAGRYLRVRVRLTGNGAVSPRLFALRLWGPRFSYRDHYLPAFLQIEDGPGAEGSDFMDRYLALFESVLSPMEADIAWAARLANPATIPAEALDWLAAWIGLQPDSALGVDGQRRVIAHAARLAPWRGTLRGLNGALDIASDGGVSAGRIVVVEHFRMRRTLATILGRTFDTRFDPLTRGRGLTANSDLGPGFFLGAEDEQRLFALFGQDLNQQALTETEAAGVFDGSALRLTVLVHDETNPERLALLQRVIRREVPAHVLADLRAAPGSLILGLTALLGVETRTAAPPPVSSLQLGQSRIGQGRLHGTPSIDQRI